MSFILIYKMPLSFPYTLGCWTITFYGPGLGSYLEIGTGEADFNKFN